MRSAIVMPPADVAACSAGDPVVSSSSIVLDSFNEVEEATPDVSFLVVVQVLHEQERFFALLINDDMGARVVVTPAAYITT